MRVRHKPWAKEKLQQHSNLVISDVEDYKGKWEDAFGREAPLYVEIGTGKGQFITGMARMHPSVSFIGIEMLESVIVTALDKVLEAEIENVRLLNQDARDLQSFFAENEVDRIYLNFSDPWPKNRHEKRRLTYKDFLSLYEKVLKPGGEVHLKTDNQGLFDYSLESFNDYGLEVKNVTRDLHNSNFVGNVMTEYEQKFSERGQPIYRCEARFER
ncbi:MAG TPA: tRNA (guanosine(46)-N7)-methyltransferase TrmB [Bacillales bacterium]|nr:tRNA (guanosine(46)-N7)-methyltransferase TrmB [Bacillales bacterium]